MSKLKDALVKLGSTNPELRPHIRPVLASLSKSATPTGDDLDNLLQGFLQSVERIPGVAKAAISDFEPSSYGAEVDIFVWAATPSDEDLRGSDKRPNPGRVANTLKAAVKRLVATSDGTLRFQDFTTPLQDFGPIEPDTKNYNPWTGRTETWTSPTTIAKFYQRNPFKITLYVYTDKSQLVYV